MSSTSDINVAGERKYENYRRTPDLEADILSEISGKSHLELGESRTRSEERESEQKATLISESE